MELPHVGEHCSNKDCNRLDFLPYKCEYCNKKFCENHWKANDHSCENQHKILDFRIPTCPICNLPVPINRGEDPNYKVENHIRMGCSKIPGKSGKNPGQKGAQCGFDGCKPKGMVFTVCSSCGNKYCLKHRHEADHNCKPNIGKKKLYAGLDKYANALGSKLAMDNRNHPNKTKSNKGCAIS
ncbi:hypothetical protein BB558_001373 [Smittium angustum]|uniref:AN1-type domain-containing protein n=1 Tax=Smittium angustum TaxID=133377 RepID=A0A2U1JBX6_SMIAN|nr:hypothetical protein BB558_001373 [Smittium angustum]